MMGNRGINLDSVQCGDEQDRHAHHKEYKASE